MTPERAFASVAHQPGAAWLDGTSGWSILAWDPVDAITETKDWGTAGRRATLGAAGSASVPFPGGLLGYIGFGAVAAPFPGEAPAAEPPVWLGRYEGGLCYRHADNSWHPAGSRGFVSDAQRVLRTAAALSPPAPIPPRARAHTVSRSDYRAAARRILAWIEAGDCYQVNLTRPVWVHDAGDPWPAYRRLRRAPAAYGAYLRPSERIAILSNSPELFLEVRGRQVASLPIKGTRPRGVTPIEDAALRQELAQSDKERAELTMIVDLVRNDLAQVCTIGSVHTGQRTLTAHPTVHHAAWRVAGQLRDDADTWDALAAAFPPGSVTGAPKLRACERIAVLESHPRGVYCGAIGYVAPGGDAVFNVAIRTAVFDGTDARYHVGGGIVAHSDPDAEWAETVAKGRALAAAMHL